MPKPWERNWGAPQSSGPAVVFQAPPDPYKAASERRSDEDQALQRENMERQRAKDRREQLEWDATHNPDGTPKAKVVSEKPLPAWAEKPYSDGISQFGGVSRGLATFQDDYAGNAITGGLENDIQGRFSSFGTPGQRDWWAQFGSTDNVIRNDLFGASLTDGEKAAYAGTTVNPSMDPAEVRKNLQSRRDILAGALKRRTNFLKAQGYSKEAIEALAGEYAQELGAAIVAPEEPPKPGEDSAAMAKVMAGDPLRDAPPPGSKVVTDPGVLVPTDVANKVEQQQLSPEQQAAYDAFNKANPRATADQLRTFANSINWNLANADDIVKARDQGGGVASAANAIVKDPDISDVRGKGGFAEGADAAVRGAADTLSLGFADEITAAGKTLFSGGTMDENLRRERAIDRYDAENSPWLRGAGQFAGGLAFPIGRGATTVAELAGVGGLTGAGYGIGSGENWADRGIGGLTGGVAGAALGAGFGKLGEIWKNKRPPAGGPSGGAADTARDVAEASADLGIDMLPADAGGPLARGMTTIARSTPGGIVPITRAAQRSQRQAGNALTGIAEREGAILDPESMGNAVRDGALSYRSGSRNSIGRIYDRAADEAGDARITPSAALDALDRNIAELSEVPGGADGLAVLQGLREDLANRGTITVNGIRGMRTQLRQKFAKDNLRGSDVERRVNEVIDAASGDLISSLEAQGKTAAARSYAEADRQWAERIKTLDDVIMPIIGKKGEKSGEQIAAALNSAAKGNNARLGKLFDALPEEEAGAARATMIDNLGKASPGAQNAAGDEFSFNSFLTNWNKLGNSAKNSIFRGENREAIDKLALLAERSKAASKYQNYSGPALPVVGAMTGGTAVASVFTLGKVLAAQYAAGRLLASPKVAKALLSIAQAKNPQAAATRINNLSNVAAREPMLSAEIGQLQQRLLQAMNDNVGRPAAASDNQQKSANP